MSLMLEIKSVKKKYKKNHALRGVSLEIERGEIFGLLGVNGAGKTTLSSIIATLLKPTSGDVLWDGTSIYKSLLNYRNIVGFCPQKPNLDAKLSLEHGLTYAGRYYGMDEQTITKRRKELIKAFDLSKYADQNAHVLSGGYKQRFILARTLMHYPKLVILDEPTVGLDPHVRHQLWDFIQGLKDEGVTVILTTHYLDEAEALCDRVCMIDNGAILTIETPANLMKAQKSSKLEDVFLKLIDQKGDSE